MPTEDAIHNAIYGKQTVEFVTVGNQFCALMESPSIFSRKDFIEKAQKLLALLYFKGSVLPVVEDSSEYEIEKFVTETDWLFVKNAVSIKLADKEIFSDLFEPLNPDEPISISLSECFADIYQDLKNFVKLYELGNAEAIYEGIWECNQSFQQIWGPRLLFVLKEIHNMLFGNYDMVEKETKDDQNENEVQKQSRTWLNDNFFNKQQE